jgi:Opacity protein and related surface antigens
VTGRVGVAANAALFYAKGGYAWVDNKFSATVLGVTNSDSKIHSGYTIGGGVEYMFAPNWSAKAEYMFTHLDSQTYNLFGLALDSGTAEFNSVKVGINYHFN